MSPPAKTSNAAIIAAARHLIERDGVENLTMSALAAAVGIRAPSLYKRYSGRDAILGAVEQELFTDLGQRLADALKESRIDTLRAACHAYRDFAHDHPNCYKLMFSASSLRGDEAESIRARAAMPVIDYLAKRVGPARALPAARTFTAFLHGFVAMELGGAFHLKGDVEQAFRYGVAALQAGLKSR